jgi:putative oxidoreductase
MPFDILLTFVARLALVLLFFPFSALDKILNFKGAVAQANEAVSSRAVATALIAAGFCIEVFMSLGVLLGVADRLAAFILAGYCAVTALLWKQFWATGDFTLRGASKGRDLFWDFLKNFAVAGGFLLLAFGAEGGGVAALLHAPLSSTHPYSQQRELPP